MGAKVQSGSWEADQIVDPASGVGGAPSAVVLPGSESQFQMAFSVGNPRAW